MTVASILFMSTLGLAGTTLGQGQSLPPGGTSLIGPNPMEALALHGETSFGKITREAGAEGGSILVETLRRPQNEWTLQLAAYTNEAVEVGDVVLASFWVQAVKGQPETGEARTQVSFQTIGPSWSQSASKTVNPGRNLDQVLLPFTVQHARPAGESMLVFNMGYAPQSFRISRFQLVTYKKALKVSDLPFSATKYRGEELDAPWRKAANERIRKIRMGDLKVVVKDSKGRPVNKAQVKVEMVKHYFPFGSALDAAYLVGNEKGSDQYRDVFLKHFNFAVLENHLKWPFWEEWGKKDGLLALDWLNRQGIPVRGHTIIWPGHGNLPKDFPSLAGKPEAMRERIEGRLKDIISATKGKVVEWDVVNEPYANQDVMKTLGWGEMAVWFRRAKELDTKPRLTLNDYPPLDGSDLNNAHLNHFYGQIEALQKAGAPIEAIGFQCHIGSRPIPPENLLKGLDRFSKFGLPIVVTEFDIETTERALQAKYMRDFMTALFSHPSVANITQWGFWQGRHWMPNAGLWDRDWTIRPHGQVFLDLIHKEWSTNASLASKSDGTASVRAFYGTYKVTVKGSDGKIKTVDFAHIPGRASLVEVRLP